MLKKNPIKLGCTEPILFVQSDFPTTWGVFNHFEWIEKWFVLKNDELERNFVPKHLGAQMQLSLL